MVAWDLTSLADIVGGEGGVAGGDGQHDVHGVVLVGGAADR